MEGTVPMTWNEITSLEGPFDGKNSSLCEGVFKPDHLLVSMFGSDQRLRERGSQGSQGARAFRVPQKYAI